MQRYRVNLPVLIGIVVGSIALIGGSYGLYKFQKSRNASRLLDRAEVALADGDLHKSTDLLGSYLMIRPGDEEVMSKLSLQLADIAEDPKAVPSDFWKAAGFMEATVREFPERDDLRRRLVELYRSKRQLKPALDHVSQLLNRTPNDPELEAMRSECYFAAADAKAVPHALKLVGYDQTTEEFDESKAITPHNASVYSRLAYNLKTEKLEDELAQAVIDRMIEVNPESGEAYLAKGQWLELQEKRDEAIEAIRKALELAPEEPSIVIANARLAMRDKEFDQAKSLIEASIEDHPTEIGLYQTLSEIEIGSGDYAAALAACDRGIAAAPITQSQGLLVQKARLQLQQNALDDARESIAVMREGEMIHSAYPDYFEARLMMEDQKWLEAATVFEKYQQYFAGNPSMALELNVMLGLCREKLGQDELALEAFNQALLSDRGNVMADQGRLRTMQKIGRVGNSNEGVSIYAALAEELAKPESKQNWKAFDKVCEEYIDRMKLGKGMLLVLKGEVQMRRGNYDEARKLLVQAYKEEPDNLGVRRAAVKLFAADPEQGPAKALGLLDGVVKKFGDLPILRLERADLLSVINDENLTEQLFALTEGTEDWETPQKIQLWKGLADKFGRLRDEESRAECLRKVVELSPGDLPTLLETFSVALASNDVAGAKEAQDAVLEVVGSKEDPTWLYMEANRLLANWRAAGGKGDGAKEAVELVNQAISQRSEWHELYNLKADIAAAQGDYKSALDSYDRAAKLGRQDGRSLFQYIKILRARGRAADALEQMEKINRESRVRLLGADYAESLLQVGREAEAVEAAKLFAAEAPNNASIQLWFGRFLTQASTLSPEKSERRKDLLTEAGAAFLKTTELAPTSGDGWMALVGYYAATGDGVKADDTVRRAHLALTEDQNLLLFARCYELVGRAIDAEGLYRLALEGAEDADRARVSRLLAQFYLGPAYRRDDAVDKATPLVNGILKDAAEETISPNDQNAQWARSTAARLLARSGAYQDLRNAEKLIASNSDDGALPVDDRLLMAEILAPRPEPVSRLKAANLLEEVGKNSRLSMKSELDLARLYFALDQWQKCREQMLDIIGRNPDNPQVRLAYLEMLLQRGGQKEIDLAVRQVQRLNEIAPNELGTREMLARVAFEKGKKREATKALLSMLPSDASKITAEQLPLVNRIAMRMVQFEDIETARKLFELSAKLGGVNDKFRYAQFVGERIDAEQGFKTLEELRDDIPTSQLVQGGLAILRALEAKDAEIPAARFERVKGWLDRGLREDPDLIALRLQQAELFDVQRKDDEAADAYRKLLERKDLKGASRAVVLNNLAYLLALGQSGGSAISEADGYVAEAVDLLGPGTEILDTRAVIAIADKRYKDAIEDLKLAVIDNPTASKYFHLATAYSMAGDVEGANDAWQEALDRGLTRESVSRLEKEQFDRTQQRIETGKLTSTAG
ncbi:tetratricopeptide repeat protein [Botrimarina colliarenosi]|uniref:Tetratricopeptide repeat protein n=1 Tax=Botrimarina colliarenosi TaxID=2528001 RepID=A0A5C6ALL3_9BACT|nr:tetratricopeptide repeat protein [Botrimarina colliarenosi]TWU00530.1 tetratricopeptide repeat protein [Botrimarina colliarenosi]